MASLKDLNQLTQNSQAPSDIPVYSEAKKRRLRKKNALLRKDISQIFSGGEDQPDANSTRKKRKPRKKLHSLLLPHNKSSEIDDNSLNNQVSVDINNTAVMTSRTNLVSKSSDSNAHNYKTIIIRNSQHKKSPANATKSENIASKDDAKTRQEILSEREEKKVAKQNTKKKQSTNDADIMPKAATAPVISVTKQEPRINNKAAISQSIKGKPINVAEIESSQKKYADVKDGNSEAKREDSKGEHSVKVEKTRDEIKAEREAKKLAKQLARSKVKGDTDSAASTGAKPLTGKNSTNNAKIVLEINKPSDVNELALNLNSVHIQTTAEKEPEDSKSKVLLRAERRAKQEAQRAAKEKAKLPPAKSVNAQTEKASKEQGSGERKLIKIEDSKATKVITSEKIKAKSIKSLHKVKLFQHLYAEREVISRVTLNSKDVHPAMVRLGVQYASRVIAGSNARCISLLNALKVIITDYVLPAKTEFARGLETYLASNMAFLKCQRPLAVSMINALNHLRWQLTQLPNNITEFDAKSQLNKAIDTYIREQIEVAGEAISIAVKNKISNGDVILTYGCSSLIEKILCEAWECEDPALKRSFSVVVVGSRPGHDGHELLRRLAHTGLPCTYVDITALSYVMRRTNKVLLGAGALLANGSVMARAGTAQVALVAHAHNVPVLVCCETHKFSERVQTDSFVYNEIGDPDELVQIPSGVSPLCDWRSIGAVTPLNLTYDVTPPDLVTAVVTELAILPCTSVPVVLRFKLSEYGI